MTTTKKNTNAKNIKTTTTTKTRKAKTTTKSNRRKVVVKRVVPTTNNKAFPKLLKLGKESRKIQVLRMHEAWNTIVNRSNRDIDDFLIIGMIATRDRNDYISDSGNVVNQKVKVYRELHVPGMSSQDFTSVLRLYKYRTTILAWLNDPSNSFKGRKSARSVVNNWLRSLKPEVVPEEFIKKPTTSPSTTDEEKTYSVPSHSLPEEKLSPVVLIEKDDLTPEEVQAVFGNTIDWLNVVESRWHLLPKNIQDSIAESVKETFGSCLDNNYRPIEKLRTTPIDIEAESKK